MNDIIAIPTVEQINLEHQLANSKANEAVQHATNCGLMLLQIKASKQHGEWLPWLNGEIESGRLKVKARQANTYMKIASNPQRDADLVGAPSIRAALELLSDKEPDEQQGTLIDVEAERKARAKAEADAESERQARQLAEQRAQEFGVESNERRLKIRELTEQIDLLKSQPAPKPQVVEKAPDDYEAAKKQAAELQMQTQALQKQLETLQKQQDKIINDQVKTKLQERETELNDMEQRKRFMEQEVERLKNYMASLDSDAKRNEVHQSVIEEQRLQLISLAAFLTDADPIRDSDTIKKWRALAAMHRDAAHGIDAVFGKPHLELAA